mgnify:CR=1 FL=1
MISNRALDGDLFENNFIKKLNSNKNNSYWRDMGFEKNKDLFFVKVYGNKKSTLNEKKIKPKTDVYLFKQNISKNELEKIDYFFDEKNNNYNFDNFIKGSGISLKMNNAKSIQVDKCSVNKFEKRFGSKELFFGLTIYTSEVSDLKKNFNVLKATNLKWNDIADYFSIDKFNEINFNTKFDQDYKKIFKSIHKISKKKIENTLLNNADLFNSLFTGINEFAEPYCASWLLKDGKLTKEIPDPKKIQITKGSSNGGKSPQVSFKL